MLKEFACHYQVNNKALNNAQPNLKDQASDALIMLLMDAKHVACMEHKSLNSLNEARIIQGTSMATTRKKPY